MTTTILSGPAPVGHGAELVAGAPFALRAATCSHVHKATVAAAAEQRDSFIVRLDRQWPEPVCRFASGEGDQQHQCGVV